MRIADEITTGFFYNAKYLNLYTQGRRQELPEGVNIFLNIF